MYVYCASSTETIGCFLPPKSENSRNHIKRANAMRPTHNEKNKKSLPPSYPPNETKRKSKNLKTDPPIPPFSASIPRHSHSHFHNLQRGLRDRPRDLPSIMSNHHQQWRFNGMLLTPTTQTLQAYTINLLHQTLPDPLLTLRFTNSSNKLIIRKSMLTNATPELCALVSPPFLNNNTTTLTLHYESFHAFHIIRNYLYLLPVNMSLLTPHIALTADRWGLHHLFHAYLYFVRTYQFPTFDAFITASLPLMHHPRLPPSFRRAIAFRLATNLHQLRHWLMHTPVNQPNHFRQTLLWQALHKQRILTCFIKYIHNLHHTSSFDYISFVTHGLQVSLNEFITYRDRASIMSRAVSLHIPRMPVFQLPQPRFHRTSFRVRIPHKNVPVNRISGTNFVARIVVRGFADVKLIYDDEQDGKPDILVTT